MFLQKRMVVDRALTLCCVMSVVTARDVQRKDEMIRMLFKDLDDAEEQYDSHGCSCSCPLVFFR